MDGTEGGERGIDGEELAAADEREGAEPAPASISMGASVEEGDEMGGGREEDGKGRGGGAAALLSTSIGGLAAMRLDLRGAGAD